MCGSLDLAQVARPKQMQTATFSREGIDGKKKPAIMGGSLGRKRRVEGKGAEAGPEVL